MIPIVSFFTKDTPYQQEAMGMAQSARNMDIDGFVYLYPVDHTGTWAKNCALKPEILLKACEELKTPFLYVDADARFTKYPVLFDIDWSHYELGLHFYRGIELLTGTIWVNPCESVIRLFEQWRDVCKAEPGKWDQKVLAQVIKNAFGMTKILRLPPEYTFIFDLSKRFYGSEVANRAVITHYQASRRYRIHVPYNKGDGQ